MNKLVKVELTEQAADILAWFTGHQFYGNDLSSVVVDHAREWACREHRKLKDFLDDVQGSYKDYLRKLS